MLLNLYASLLILGYTPVCVPSSGCLLSSVLTCSALGCTAHLKAQVPLMHVNKLPSACLKLVSQKMLGLWQMLAFGFHAYILYLYLVRKEIWD